MDSNEHRELGALSARMDNVEKTVDKIDTQVGEMHGILMQARGSWKTLVVISGISATIGALITKLWAIFPHLPK